MKPLLDRKSRKVWVFDLEVFPNFFMANFQHGNALKTFFLHEGKRNDIPALLTFLRNNQIVLGSYNGFGYDEVILKWMLHADEVDNAGIYALSCEIINESRNSNRVFKLQYAKTPWAYSIDVFMLLNKNGSLKEWGCREGLPRIVESAASFTEDLKDSDVPQIIEYCKNDVGSTHTLIERNWHLVQIRDRLDDEYDLGNRIYCLGEAGVAQCVFLKLHNLRTGQWSSKTRDNAEANQDNQAREFPLTELISDKVKFTTPEFSNVLKSLKKTSAIGNKTGTTWKYADPNFKAPFELGGKAFQIGVGGLHSVDSHGVFSSDKSSAIIDLDVTSYYPSLVINENLYPVHIGPAFVADMRELRDKRVAAKKKGDKATDAALKVVINATFGKLNDAFSPLRSVPDALRVTINGQLMLLMLIEELGKCGASILSANTDGVTIKWDRYKLKTILPIIIKRWETATGHTLEHKEFSVYCRRDVNNYIALLTDGSVKCKGAFNQKPLAGKWDGFLAKKAAEAFLLKGIPLEKTVRDCTNPVDFMFYQRVKNGGCLLHGDTHVGKIARWYVSTSSEAKQLFRQNPDKSKAKIPGGAHAMLAMDISDWDVFGMPEDVDHSFYIQEAQELVDSTKKKQKKVPRD